MGTVFRAMAHVSICLALGIGALPANVLATTTFTSSADFFAALGSAPTLTETFEGFAPGTVIGTGATFNGITYAGFPAGTFGGLIDVRFASIGDQSLAVERDGAAGGGAFDFFFRGESLSLSFAVPVTSFGVFINVASSALVSDYLFVNTPVGSVLSGGSTPDVSTLFFAGLISDTAFSSVRVGATSQSPSGFNIDNLVRTPIPEPSSIVLMLVGLACFAARHLGQRRSNS